MVMFAFALLALLLGASAADRPSVMFAANRSNLPSAAATDWYRLLGRATSLQACADLCIDWNGSSVVTPAATTRCRSFIRYADSYRHNASLAGQCVGRIDSAWLPLVIDPNRGRIDSGQVLWACEDAMDCSLNGQCAAASGKCSCSSGWTGARCQALDLEPVSRLEMGFNPQLHGANMSSWGGSVIQVAGKWHMWCSLLANHCGIGSYLVNSGVVHAVSQSDLPTGPYAQADSVLPPFAHEPVVSVAPTGELVLAAVSGPLGAFHSCQCTDGTTSRGCIACNNSCHPQYKTLAISATGAPGGPWEKRMMFPNAADNNGENPSIWIARDGSAYGMRRGAHVAAFASDWRNASTWKPNPWPSFVSSQPDVEDPFIYQDEDDNFHALAHNLEGAHMCGGLGSDCLVGVHVYSRDARTWMYGGLAYTAAVEVRGEAEPMVLNRRERPHLSFAEGSRRPVALVTSAEYGHGFGDRSFTLVQAVRGKKGAENAGAV